MILKYNKIFIISILILIAIVYYFFEDDKKEIIIEKDKEVIKGKEFEIDPEMSISEFIVNKNNKADKYRKQRTITISTKTLKDSLTQNIINNSEINRTKLVLNKYYKLKKLSMENNNPNIKDDDNITVLMYATFAQDYGFIDELIHQGADINAIGKMGSTALMLSTLKKDLNMTKQLIEYGAEINLNGAYNPLLMSTRLDDIDTIKYLVDMGADIEAKTPIKQRNPSYECFSIW